jgi:uncharacterized membrane protein YccC
MPAPASASSSAAASKNVVNLRQAFKLALSLVLFYLFALSLNWDEPNYGALAVVLVSLGTRGASIEKAVARVIGTTFGVAIGFLILGLFNHDRWATMVALAGYVTLIGYFMQGSGNSYAWFVAGFVPLVIWGNNYPHFDNAFYFGTFRWLQTTTGIVIYTLIDLVLWPRHAGDQLNQKGRSLWSEVQDLFAAYRAKRSQTPTEPISSQRAKIAGTLASTLTNLQQAYLDTPGIRVEKKAWQEWQKNTRSTLNALELWGESIDDCRAIDLHSCIPKLADGLLALEKRFQRIGVRWQLIFSGDVPASDDDAQWLQPLDFEINAPAFEALSAANRSALLCCVEQLKTVDQTSRSVLRSERILAGLETGKTSLASATPSLEFRPSPWDHQRWLHALFPAVAFVSAFFFWVYMDPPTGAKVPMFAGIISLVTLRTPMNPVLLLVALILSVFLTVAPIYWLVMPALGTGVELLAMVFIYALFFGYLGGSRPILKSGPLIMFVNMSGISNEQSYSFQAPVDGALMTLLGGAFVALAYWFFKPPRPEQSLLHGLEHFFSGCALMAAGFSVDDRGTPEKSRASRIRCLESLVLPGPASMQAMQKHLDYKRLPDGSAEQIQQLQGCMQSIANRLQSIEVAVDRFEREAPELREVLAPLSAQVRETVEGIFRGWTRPQSWHLPGADARAFDQASRDLAIQLDTLQANSAQGHLSDPALKQLYTIIGSVRGLIEAMFSTQNVLQQIDWQQLGAARF